MRNRFQISNSSKLSLISALSWSGVSVLYNFSLLMFASIAIKLFTNKQVNYFDNFNLKKDIWLKFFDVVIIAPIIETLLVVFLFNFFSKIKFQYLLNYLTVATIFCAIHLITHNWIIALKIAVLFQIQLYYISIRIKYVKFSIICTEGVLIHLMHNAIVFTFSYYLMKNI
ncbi:MAG: hypothetical protein RI956_749 [Pseudomonadota bacterium]